MIRLRLLLLMYGIVCATKAQITEEAAEFVENVQKLAILTAGGDSDSEYGVQKAGGQSPVVLTTSGIIYGADTETDHSFYAVPFAQPPVGQLRYKPPQPLQSETAERNCTVPKQILCPQSHSNCTKEPCKIVQEDCLILDIHVPIHVELSDPGKPPSDRLPVMVWMHGGAFFFGSGTFRVYDGRYLSNVTNAIVVTVNYRLGPFGFLVHGEGDEAIAGNQGLKDQQQALRWVQENIENFGGDKDRVTIFGESAGAQSVMFHLLSGASEPLFHRAIMESNPAVYMYPDRVEALDVTDRLLRIFRGSSDPACGLRESDSDCLYEATMENLISATTSMMILSLIELDLPEVVEPFRPYIDGEEYKEQPLKLFRDGIWQTHKPFIIGTNLEELDVLKYFNPLELEIGEVGFKALNRLLFGNETGDLLTQKYEEMATENNITDYGLLAGKLATDLVFGCPSRALARYASATAEEGSVYLYTFNHWLDGEDCEEFQASVNPNLCGYSHHGAEIGFVFRTIEHLGMIPDEEDIVVSDQFSTYWGSFARTGSPSEGLETPLQGKHPTWPPYTKHALRMDEEIGSMHSIIIRRNLKAESSQWPNMKIEDPVSYIEYNFDQDICDFWDTLGVYMEAVTTPTATATMKTTSSNGNEVTGTLAVVPESTTDGAGAASPCVFILLLSLATQYMQA